MTMHGGRSLGPARGHSMPRTSDEMPRYVLLVYCRWHHAGSVSACAGSCCVSVCAGSRWLGTACCHPSSVSFNSTEAAWHAHRLIRLLWALIPSRGTTPPSYSTWALCALRALCGTQNIKGRRKKGAFYAELWVPVAVAGIFNRIGPNLAVKRMDNSTNSASMFKQAKSKNKKRKNNFRLKVWEVVDCWAAHLSTAWLRENSNKMHWLDFCIFSASVIIPML